MKFNVNGRETEYYYLTDREVLDLLRGNTLNDEQRKFLHEYMQDRFEHRLCTKSGETEDDVFVRFFSDFVNGEMISVKKVADGMANEHRYLQSEMFKVCLEYIKRLAESANDGRFDGRNEWACQTSRMIVDALKEKEIFF